MIEDMSIFCDYFWKKGRPVGFKKANPNSHFFKIISDPYFKRFSIERYENGLFKEIIYDSNLFDFRHLRQEEAAWQREVLYEDENTTKTIIRNIDDRIILHEDLMYENTNCFLCRLYSPHGLPIGYQKVFLQSHGDPWNGVTFFDRNHHPVLTKKYAIDPQTQEFKELLEEIWEHPYMNN